MNEQLEDLSSDPLMLEIARLQFQSTLPNKDYFWITVLGTEDGMVEHFVYSQWVNYTKTHPTREIRKASAVNVESCRKGLNLIKQPFSIINNKKDLYIFSLIGGHGIIEKSLAKKYFADLIKPKIMIYSSSQGFTQLESVPIQKRNHAPTRKVRMNVLKRDRFRCLSCGRSPSDHVDIELHVHHIFPWGMGGITEEENLITLCSTCHGGLDPHYEPQLQTLLPGERKGATAAREKHVRGLILYMEAIKTNLDSIIP